MTSFARVIGANEAKALGLLDVSLQPIQRFEHSLGVAMWNLRKLLAAIPADLAHSQVATDQQNGACSQDLREAL